MKTIVSKDKLLLAILIICLAVVILPVLIACAYALPASDDFTVSIDLTGGDSLLLLMLKRAKECYFGWQGAYFGTFLGSVPYYHLFGITGLRTALAIIATLFFIAFIVLVKEGCYWFGVRGKNKAISMVLLSTIMLMLLIRGDYESEIFYWLSGTWVYTIPLAFSMLCVACYIAYEKKHSCVILVAGCIFALMGAGGQPNVCALLCALLLFLISYDFFITKAKSKNSIMGLFALAGSIINTIAPGNYARYDTMDDSGLHLFRAAFYSAARFLMLLYNEFQSGLLLIVLGIAFIVVYLLCKNSTREFKYPGLVTIYAVFGILITDFPVCLGYSSAPAYWPPRVAFTERLAMILFFTFCAAYWGAYCAKKKLLSFKREHYFMLALMLLLAFSTVDITNLGSLRMLVHIGIGDFAAISEAEMNVLEQIKEAGAGDVTVYYDTTELDNRWSNLKRVELTIDPTHWINESVAQYYGLDSVTVIYSDAVE